MVEKRLIGKELNINQVSNEIILKVDPRNPIFQILSIRT